MAGAVVARNARDAYVYEIRVDGVARYIGKGRGGRAWSHEPIARRLLNPARGTRKLRRSVFYGNLSAAIAAGQQIDVRIIRDALTDEEAYRLEAEAIEDAPLFQLWNVSAGGAGLTSERLREIMSAPETREKISASVKKAWSRSPERRGARFAADGSRDAQSQMALDKCSDPDYRARQSAARSVSRPSRRGVKVPALSLPAKERWATPEFRDRATEAIRAACSGQNRRAAISDRLKKAWADPESRAKRLEGMRLARQKRRDAAAESA